MESSNLVRPLPVPNTGMVTFRDIHNPDGPQGLGHLTPITGGIHVPFDIKRIYYIHSVGPDIRRGFHSHRDLHQVLIALGGSVKVLVKTPFEETVVELNKPWEGLYIGPYIWREMFDFSEHATLLVLASADYTESDYLRKYEDYEPEAKEYFTQQR